MSEFPRDLFPDEVASVYWGRAVCLEQLGRLAEASRASSLLIEEVGSGATPTQRFYVAGVYVLQAKTAEAQGRFTDALRALDAAVAYCARFEDPDLKAPLHEAEQMQAAIRYRVRPAP